MSDGPPQADPHVEQSSPRVARIGRVSGVVLAVAAYLSGPALGLSREATWVFALLALMACFWVTLAVEPAVTGLVPFVVVAVLGIGTPTEIVG